MNLQETDYGQLLANEPVITPKIVEQKLVEKLVAEFSYIRANSVEPLSTFMDYISIEFMIENVMLLLRGSLSGRNVNELMKQCHPLGMFKESIMRNIPNFEASPRGYAELYEIVLVDTPIGPYFQQYLDMTAGNVKAASDVRNILEEVQMEILKNSLMKLYLEDFAAFAESLGGETGECMSRILSARADRLAINVTLNSFGTALNTPQMRDKVRRNLYPSFGELYPAGSDLLSKVDDDQKLVQALSWNKTYSTMFEKYLNSKAEDFSIDDEFFRREVMLYETSFDSQMNLAIFLAYIKLKEQEIRNLVWISECILQKRKDKINNYIPIFSSASEWRCESTRRTAGGH
jgi:V-type H+-transporting ATPase subunit d